MAWVHMHDVHNILYPAKDRGIVMKYNNKRDNTQCMNDERYRRYAREPGFRACVSLSKQIG
ncbi:MAG TPA: hypothetical protein O0Y05_00320 [Methanocorpusculum sp.]|nr:hypothetical protein [Methanocorpusculum sp.]